MSELAYIAESGRAYWFWMTPPKAYVVSVIRAVAARHGLSVDDLKGPSRKRTIAHARQEAMWELRNRTRLSLPHIAHHLNRRDHTTALHAVRAHARRLAEASE